jgi:hypothetical protein
MPVLGVPSASGSRSPDNTTRFHSQRPRLPAVEPNDRQVAGSALTTTVRPAATGPVPGRKPCCTHPAAIAETNTTTGQDLKLSGLITRYSAEIVGCPMPKSIPRALSAGWWPSIAAWLRRGASPNAGYTMLRTSTGCGILLLEIETVGWGAVAPQGSLAAQGLGPVPLLDLVRDGAYPVMLLSHILRGELPWGTVLGPR